MKTVRLPRKLKKRMARLAFSKMISSAGDVPKRYRWKKRELHKVSITPNFIHATHPRGFGTWGKWSVTGYRLS